MTTFLPLTPQALAIFVVAALLMNASPGPSNLYVLSRTVAGGRPAGLASVAGLASGALCHALLVAFGLGALLASVPLVYVALKVAGAVYLIFLGLRALRSVPAGRSRPQRSTWTPGLARVYAEAVMVELTNPKTALFFLSFLPQFVPAEHASPAAFLALGVIVVATALPLDLAVALAAGAMKRRLSGDDATSRLMNRLSGGILVALGLYLLAETRSPSMSR